MPSVGLGEGPWARTRTLECKCPSEPHLPNPAVPLVETPLPPILSFAERCQRLPSSCLGYQDRLAEVRRASARSTPPFGPNVTVESGTCGAYRYVEERLFDPPAASQTTWYFAAGSKLMGRRSVSPGADDGPLASDEGAVPTCALRPDPSPTPAQIWRDPLECPGPPAWERPHLRDVPNNLRQKPTRRPQVRILLGPPVLLEEKGTLADRSAKGFERATLLAWHGRQIGVDGGQGGAHFRVEA